MTNTTYFPRTITVKGKHMELAPGLCHYIGNFKLAALKARVLRTIYRQENTPYVVRRVGCNVLTYR